MSATAIVTQPVLADVYKWQTADVTDEYLATNDATFPLENVEDPILNNRGRTGNGADPGGLKSTLTAQINVCAVEVANTGALASEDVEVQLFSDAAWVTTTLATTAWPQRPDEVWTGHTGHHLTRPIRSNCLLGYDSFSGGTGPVPAATPDVATVACQSLRVIFSTKDASRSKWECGFVGLGIDGFRLPALYQSSVQVDMVDLKWGDGFQWTVTWAPGGITPQLAQQITALYAKSGRGTAPVFFFPCPGQRSSTGVITATETPPYLRGGLARFVAKPGFTAQTAWVNDWQNPNFRMVLQTWETP